MTIQSKIKSRSSGQHFSKSLWSSRAGNSPAKSQKWAKIEILRDFMPVRVICKFDEDSIKNEVAIVRTTFSPLYVYVDLLVAVETKVQTRFSP